MTRHSSWFRSPRLRRNQLSNHRGLRSPAGDSRLRNRRLLLERLEDRSLLAAIDVSTSGDLTISISPSDHDELNGYFANLFLVRYEGEDEDYVSVAYRPLADGNTYLFLAPGINAPGGPPGVPIRAIDLKSVSFEGTDQIDSFLLSLDFPMDEDVVETFAGEVQVSVDMKGQDDYVQFSTSDVDHVTCAIELGGGSDYYLGGSNAKVEGSEGENVFDITSGDNNVVNGGDDGDVFRIDSLTGGTFTGGSGNDSFGLAPFDAGFYSFYPVLMNGGPGEDRLGFTVNSPGSVSGTNVVFDGGTGTNFVGMGVAGGLGHLSNISIRPGGIGGIVTKVGTDDFTLNASSTSNLFLVGEESFQGYEELPEGERPRYSVVAAGDLSSQGLRSLTVGFYDPGNEAEDTLDISALEGDLTVQAFLGAGDDNFFGGTVAADVQGEAGGDKLLGGSSDETLDGGAGDDILEGNEGNDILKGGADNDLYLFWERAEGDDEVHEESGKDTLNYFSLTDKIELDIGITTKQEVAPSLELTLFGSKDIEDVVGSPQDDLIFGNDNDNKITGEKGKDTIAGGLGTDTLDGDDDNDVLDGGEGTDTLNGGKGNNVLMGDGFGLDFADMQTLSTKVADFSITTQLTFGVALSPSTGAKDTINGGDGDDLIIGGDGDDIISTGSGGSIVFGDSFQVSAGFSLDLTALTGDLKTLLTPLLSVALRDDGKDQITLGEGTNLVLGGDGDDTITGTGQSSLDILFGNNGKDTINAADGLNIISGGAGDDLQLQGGKDVDIILGDSLTIKAEFKRPVLGGPDKEVIKALTKIFSAFELVDSGDDKNIDAGNGFNLVIGGDGDDTITGGNNVDVLFGNDGKDTIKAKNGFNFISGGDGDDHLLEGGENPDIIFGDSIELATGDSVDPLDPSTIAQAFEYVQELAGLFKVEGDKQTAFGFELTETGNDENIDAGDGLNLVFGGKGDDTIFGGENGDIFFGGDGNDHMFGRNGIDLLIGGKGDDEIFGGTDEEPNVIIGDTLAVKVSGFNLKSLFENGDITGLTFPSIDIQLEDAGTDTLNGGNGLDLMIGGGGTDHIFGREGTNIVFGDDFGIIESAVSFFATVFNPLKSAVKDAVIDVLEDVATDLWNEFIGSKGVPDSPQGDFYEGGSGVDIVFGGSGGDNIQTFGGWDLLLGGEGNDVLDPGPGGTVGIDLWIIKIENIAYGGPGDDLFLGGPDNDVMGSDEGSDTFYGGGGDDVLSGGEADDTLFGEDGDDVLYGGPGIDLLDGGPGTNTLFQDDEVSAQSVVIDLSIPTLNLASNGALSLILFGATDFDVARVDISSVTFAGAYAFQSSFNDENGDGYLDLVLHFRRQETNLLNQYIELLAQADQEADGRLDDGISNHQLVDAVFSGKTLEGDLFEGHDNLDLFLTGKKLRALLDELASAGEI